MASAIGVTEEMSEMVERVARAMLNDCPGNLPWDKLPETYKNGYRSSARAAIKAMREPTDEMVDAYNNQEPLSRVAYQAMINAALK